MLALRSNEAKKSDKGKAARAEAPLEGKSATEANPLWQSLALQPSFQPKLAISQPDDPYEREADRIAAQVMRVAQPQVQRKCAACSSGGTPCADCETEQNLVQRKADVDSRTSGSVPSDLVSDLGTGRSLEPSLRSFFEPRFGRQLDRVRIHTDERAAASARAVNALAYTVGPNIVMGRGNYNPATEGGRTLLAHELAHVVQQGQAPLNTGPHNHQPSSALPSPSVSRRSISLQRKADPTGQTLLPAEVYAMSDLELDAAILKAQNWISGHAVVVIEYTTVAANLDLMIKVRDERQSKSSADAGSQTAWEEGEKTELLGLVSNDKGGELYKNPDKTKAAIKLLPLNTRLAVDRRVPGGWYFVVLTNGDYGYMAETDVNTSLPDPEATLYRIKNDDTAQGIVKQFYKDFKWGEDERFYVNVLAFVNFEAGRKGIHKPSQDAAWDTTVVNLGSQIWIPGAEYVKSLKGKISSGSFTYEVWQGIKSAASAVGDFLLGTAGLVVGILHGALESLWDLLVGIVDLIGMIWSIVKSIIQGEILSDIKALWDQISSIKLSEVFDAAANWLDAKWNAPGTWSRWHFRGWLIGYIIMEIVMLFFSDGLITAVKWVGKTTKIAKLIEAIPLLAKITKRLEAVKDLEKIKAAVKGSEALTTARRWARAVLLIPAEILGDMALEAIERLKKLPQWAIERFRELNSPAMRFVLGCASPCKVKIEEIIKYLAELTKSGKAGKLLLEVSDVLAALPSGLNTTKIAQYLKDYPALMAAIKNAEFTAEDFGKLASFLTGADKTNPETAYKTFTRYLTYAVPSKAGSDVEKFNKIVEAMMVADKEMGAAMKGSMFEAFIRTHVAEFTSKVFQRVRFKAGGALELAKEVRTSDFFIEAAGELWDFKHSLKVDMTQAADYLKILNHAEAGLPKVTSIHYLFPTKEWAEANKALKGMGFSVHYLSPAGKLLLL